MDTGRSISFITSDPNWVSRLGVAALLMLGSMIFPPLSWIVAGYALEVTRNTWQGADLPLPEWNDIGGFFVRGLLVTLAIFLWALPLVLLAIVTIGALAVIDNSGVLAAIAGVCLVAPAAILFALAIQPILTARYAVTRDFGALFRVSEVLAEARAAGFDLVIVALVSAGVYLAALVVGLLACGIGWLATFPFAQLVVAHLTGQLYRKARGMQASPATSF